MNKLPYIILASGSPRRKELLAQGGFLFEVVKSNVEEKTAQVEPGEVVKDLARQKCEDVACRIANGETKTFHESERVVVAADTIVALENRIFGKPKDEEDALRLLMELSGKTHSVYTGVCIMNPDVQEKTSICFYAQTKVSMYPFTKEEARSYIETGEPMDKAGAYGIQGRGALLVSSIEGDYNNVVGFPLAQFAQALKKV